MRYKLTPLAFIAVISLFAESPPKAISVATSTCHWYREYNDPSKVKHHQFNDHCTAQSLSCELVHELHHELKNKQKHENDERADKRCEVGPQDMAEENHDPIYELSLLLAILSAFFYFVVPFIGVQSNNGEQSADLCYLINKRAARTIFRSC